MSSNNVRRKLVAILAADAVGFSRQMGANEERTMRVLSAHRAVIDGIIEFHEGRIVGTAGDSVLAEFASPVEALRCAVEIQDAIKTRNDSLPEGERMQFRIGINLGDVMVKGDDLLGDGVNVAARLEGIAEPGGICISSSVFDQIAGKLDLGFVEIGEQNLKNIARPVRVYRVNRGTPGANVPQKIARKSMWPYALGATLVLLAAIAAALWSREESRAPPPTAAPTQTPAAPARIAEPVTAQDARAAADRAKAEQETAEARAAAEIAKARAATEVARANAETAALRRQAAADVAAARARPAEAPAVAASPAAPAPLPAPPPPSPAPAKVASASPALTAHRHCPPGPQTPEITDELPLRLEGDEIVIERGEPGQPGYLTLRGRGHGAGHLTLAGHAISGLPMNRGRQIPASFEGQREGRRFELKGHIGRLECTLTLTRRSP